MSIGPSKENFVVMLDPNTKLNGDGTHGWDKLARGDTVSAMRLDDGLHNRNNQARNTWRV